MATLETRDILAAERDGEKQAMSTRSVTTIHESCRGERNVSPANAIGGRLAALYRHCDGYPAEAGATLAEALRSAKSPSDAVAALLAHTYEATTYRPAQRIYELTTEANAGSFALDPEDGCD